MGGNVLPLQQRDCYHQSTHWENILLLKKNPEVAWIWCRWREKIATNFGPSQDHFFNGINLFPVQTRNVTMAVTVISKQWRGNILKVSEKIYSTAHASSKSKSISIIGLVEGNRVKGSKYHNTLGTLSKSWSLSERHWLVKMGGNQVLSIYGLLVFFGKLLLSIMAYCWKMWVRMCFVIKRAVLGKL